MHERSSRPTNGVSGFKTPIEKLQRQSSNMAEIGLHLERKTMHEVKALLERRFVLQSPVKMSAKPGVFSVGGGKSNSFQDPKFKLPKMNRALAFPRVAENRTAF